MSMAQCVEALVTSDRRAEREYRYRLSRIGRFVNTNYDEEMANVLRFTTHYVAEQKAPQYAAALSKAETYKYEVKSDELDIVVMNQPSDEAATGAAGRYKEVLRATHLIASELADLDDDKAFDEMICFVIQQWRNVRQIQEMPWGETQPKREREDDVESKSKPIDDPGASIKGTVTETSSAKLKVRINPKARMVGRPQKQKKTTFASERTDRKWYKAAEKGRATAGSDTLETLLDSLDQAKPGLMEKQKRLSSVLVKNTRQNPVLVDAEEDTTVTPGGVVEVDQIKDVGFFTREQIEIMRRVENLKSTVQLGLDSHKWLSEEALPALGAEYHEEARQLSDQVLNTYPYTPIEGLDNAPDYVYSMLYRAIPPSWLADASIRVDGSEVLMIQDDLDITCGVVIQTRVQKLAFEQ
ncbi:hypothetical protein GQ600_17341 [Phytophthora cactorum]|nr:hypothetical protein GQ600_17341 [Phytophthora cactorum]